MHKNRQTAAGGQPEKSTKTPTQAPDPVSEKSVPVEVGGPRGPEPTRFGDWEHNGRCSDF